MALAKPIGFDNFRPHYFVLKDGSGSKFPVKASFAIVEASAFRLFRGPNIASTTAGTTTTVTTAEAHGLKAGQTIRLQKLPIALAALNSEWVILTVPTPTTFTLGFDSTSAGTSTGIGIVGVDTGSELPTADYAMVVGGLCMETHPAAWELPLEG